MPPASNGSQRRRNEEVDGGGDEVGLVELMLLGVFHALRVVRLLARRPEVLLIVGLDVVGVDAVLPPCLEVSGVVGLGCNLKGWLRLLGRRSKDHLLLSVLLQCIV